jgi:hypothetical protein
MNLNNPANINTIWDDIAELIKSQPMETRRRFYIGIRTLVHDMVDTMGKVYSAESLLRIKLKEDPEYLELLEIIKNSSRLSVNFIKDFALHFDNPDNSDQ